MAQAFSSAHQGMEAVGRSPGGGPTIDPKAMTGLQKVATVLLLLGEQDSIAIWSHFTEEEKRAVSLTMAELGQISKENAESIADEFTFGVQASDRLVGNYARTEAFLKAVLPGAEADAIMDDIRGQSSRNVWQKLSGVDLGLIVSYLKAEHPQTVALILSRLPPQTTADVLAALPEEFSVNVLHRMLRMNTVQKEAVANVERALHQEFLGGLARTSRRDSHEAIADVFNAFDNQTEGKLMTALEMLNDEGASRVKSLMFKFEDLIKLDVASVQTLIRYVDRAVLTRALKGASDTILSLFTSNMSTRSAKGLTDDLAALGPQKVKEVTQAQTVIIMLAKDLAAKGEIRIGHKSSENEYI